MAAGSRTPACMLHARRIEPLSRQRRRPYPLGHHQDRHASCDRATKDIPLIRYQQLISPVWSSNMILYIRRSVNKAEYAINRRLGFERWILIQRDTCKSCMPITYHKYCIVYNLLNSVRRILIVFHTFLKQFLSSFRCRRSNPEKRSTLSDYWPVCCSRND